jgi:hypothetical protein
METIETKETYDANIRIRDLPRAVDTKLEAIATRLALHKWEVVRLALIEYVERHAV